MAYPRGLQRGITSQNTGEGQSRGLQEKVNQPSIYSPPLGKRTMLPIKLTLIKRNSPCSPQKHRLIQFSSTQAPPNIYIPSPLGWEDQCGWKRRFRRVSLHSITLTGSGVRGKSKWFLQVTFNPLQHMRPLAGNWPVEIEPPTPR